MIEDGVDRHYRVKATCVGGATIRSAPRQRGAVLGRLAAGATTGTIMTGAAGAIDPSAIAFAGAAVSAIVYHLFARNQ